MRRQIDAILLMIGGGLVVLLIIVELAGLWMRSEDRGARLDAARKLAARADANNLPDLSIDETSSADRALKAWQDLPPTRSFSANSFFPPVVAPRTGAPPALRPRPPR